jgi:hypothetical protein
MPQRASLGYVYMCLDQWFMACRGTASHNHSADRHVQPERSLRAACLANLLIIDWAEIRASFHFPPSRLGLVDHSRT